MKKRDSGLVSPKKMTYGDFLETQQFLGPIITGIYTGNFHHNILL